MKRHVSLDKQSKKAQKEYYSGLRRTWNGVDPATRTMPNGKAYNRKKEKCRIGRELRDGFPADSAFLLYTNAMKKRMQSSLTSVTIDGDLTCIHHHTTCGGS